MTGPGLGTLLADVGVGFVSLRSDPSGTLARTLDAAPGLARLGTTDGQTLWRVQPQEPATAPGRSASAPRAPVAPARVRITTSAGDPLLAVPVDGPHAAVDTTVAAGPAGRRLVVAESVEWSRAAVVRMDDRVLSPLRGVDTPTYDLPPPVGTSWSTCPRPARAGPWVSSCCCWSCSSSPSRSAPVARGA